VQEVLHSLCDGTRLLWQQCPCWRDERDRHTGDGGVHAGLEGRQPHTDSRDDVHRRVPDPQPSHQHHERQQSEGDPVPYRLGEIDVADPQQRHRFFPERGHVVAGGGVGHDQRGDGCGEQHHAAGGLDA